MKYALNLEPEAYDNEAGFDEFEFNEFEGESYESLDEYDEAFEHEQECECESCSGSKSEFDEAEWEAEIQRDRRPPFRPARTQPGMRRPGFKPRIIRRPGFGGYGQTNCTCPSINCPQHDSEYVRWVQSALNQVLNLRLAVTGIMDAPTRSALRSFQEKQGLPVDGIAGPETKKALNLMKGRKMPLFSPTKSNANYGEQRNKMDNESRVSEYAFTSKINFESEIKNHNFFDPLISPLSTAKYGLRNGSKRKVPIYGICVHTTGGGPARAAKKNPKRSAIHRALDFYLKGKGGFPHYVISNDGSIIATCDERQIAFHAGYGVGKKLQRVLRYYKTWTAPLWWSKVWTPKGAKSPLDLFPKGVLSANSGLIGVELLADETGYDFTQRQYESLAKLIVDISRRHNFPLSSAPSVRLLGHEDVHPMTRQNKGGGWDPGAHRDNPKFSWSHLWALINRVP
jgi:N-acetylmuramoyl-L-alanine amidase/Putative peptidoglycan binding domain